MAKPLNLCAALAALAGSWAVPALAQPAPPTSLDAVEADVARAEAIEAIKQLTYRLGYYRDALLYDPSIFDKVLRLFTDDATYGFANGQYVGKASIARLLQSKRFNVGERGLREPGPPRLSDRVMMMPTITLAPDGRTAQARIKEWSFEGEQGKSQTYSIGMYENRYRRDAAGQWQIASVQFCYRLRLPWDKGIAEIPPPPVYQPLPVFYPKDPEGPDRQLTYFCHTYPDVGVNPPFHFDNPVTGERLMKP